MLLLVACLPKGVWTPRSALIRLGLSPVQVRSKCLPVIFYQGLTEDLFLVVRSLAH